MKTLRILSLSKRMLPALLLAACALGLHAAPIPGLFNTGVNEAGALLGTNEIDPHWTLAASADPSFPGPDAFTLLPGFPVGPWIAEGPNSRWIAPQTDQSTGNAPGTYTYRTTFDLTGLDPTSAQITGRSSHDDSLTAVRLNGSSLGLTAGGFGSFHNFTIPTGSPFVEGENTLEFDVLNGGTTPNPTGFRCELSGTAVRADEPPSIAMQPESQTVIVGDTVTFTVGALGAPPLTYQWRFNGAPIPGADGVSHTIVGVTTNDAGNYSVVVNNFDGQTNSQDAVLTVLVPFPGIYNSGLDDNRMLLTDGALDPHYKLVVNADNPGSTDAFAQSTIPSPPWVPNSLKSRWIGPRADATAASGSYSYQLTLDLTGYDPATAFLAGSWATDDGGLLFLNGVDTGFRSPSFSTFSQFRLTNGFVSGTNVLEFRLVNGGMNSTGLRVENLLGTAQTNGVAPSAARILVQPRSATVYIMGSATLAVVADGTQPLNYQWFKNGAPISGQTSASLTFSPVMRTDAGTYSVRVSNSLGSTNSEVAQLTVIPEQLGVFNTGVDNTGAALPIGQPDPHYVLISSPDAAYPGPVTFATAGPIPPWFANDADSQWIAPRADNATMVPGAYTYRLIFTIDIAGEEATAAITANVGTDDDNRGVFLNGNNVGFTTGTGFGSLTPLSIPAGSGFVPGINTLDFVPNNGGVEPNPSGLRVDDIVLTGVTVPPRLSISRSGADVRFAWPVSAGSVVLQETTVLPGGWVDSSALVNVEGNENVALVTPSGSAKFYRLSR